jgi:hypothetical protein
MAEAIPPGKRVTLGGDKNYDTQALVGELRGMQITPHVAQNDTNRRSAVDERTTRHAGYAVSQRKRKRVEQSFGWMKMVGMLKSCQLQLRYLRQPMMTQFFLRACVPRSF